MIEEAVNGSHQKTKGGTWAPAGAVVLESSDVFVKTAASPWAICGPKATSSRPVRSVIEQGGATSAFRAAVNAIKHYPAE